MGEFSVRENGAAVRAVAFAVRIVNHTAQEVTLPPTAVVVRTADHRLLFPTAGVAFQGSMCFAFSRGDLTLVPQADFAFPAPLCFVLEPPKQTVATDLLVGVGSTVDFKLG